jgi:hypothetical protein
VVTIPIFPQLMLIYMPTTTFSNVWLDREVQDCSICSSVFRHVWDGVYRSDGGSPVMVERRVLIASQWVANSAMAMPVLYTLMARAVERISPKPIDYHLEGIPYEFNSKMRYFSPRECAFASGVVFLLWLMMGHCSERKIGRTFGTLHDGALVVRIQTHACSADCWSIPFAFGCSNVGIAYVPCSCNGGSSRLTGIDVHTPKSQIILGCGKARI